MASSPPLQGRRSTPALTPPVFTFPPLSSYIINPSETPITLQFGSARISDIQAKLDAARAADANSPIVLTLTGTYLVSDKPLNLPSNTSLVLYGTILALPNALHQASSPSPARVK